MGDANVNEGDENNSSENVEVFASSKEINDKPMDKQSSLVDDDGIFSIMYSVFKKVAVVGTIYGVGYMGWSVAWLILPVVLSVTRDHWRRNADLKRAIAKTSATTNERDVIMARISDLPAWVYFPDVERCEWLNKILIQVWPNANIFAKELVKNAIEPNIAKALAAYKLSGFRFDRIILGTIPPRIGGVKVYDKNIVRNEIIMDIDLFYAGDCDINFQLGGVRGGIKDFQIHGMVRVVMKPLIHKMPLIGGLQVFFLNNPSVDFNLVGIVDLLDMPGLSDILRRIIVEQIGAIMVLPNKLPITLSDDVPALTLKMPEPEGVLRIHVVEAKDLMKKDISMLGKGKSDPYAIIMVGAQQFRTHTIDNNVNPKWDFWCETVIVAKYGQYMDIQIMDKDDTSDDEKLGRATVEISNAVKSGVFDTWLTLEHAKRGMVHVRLTWLNLSKDRNDLQAALEETQLLRLTTMSTALLTVFIDSATNLPQARTQSKPDPYLILTVGKNKEQTNVQMRTDAPVWEQGFTFLVANPSNDTLQIRVMDQKTEKEIGQYTHSLNSLLDKTNMELVSQPFRLQKAGPESKVRMSLALRILKKLPTIEDNASFIQNDEQSGENSIQTNSETLSTPSAQIQVSTQQTPSAGGNLVFIDESSGEIVTKTIIPETMTIPNVTADRNESVLIHRTPSMTSSAGEFGLGRIQLTIRHSVQRQRLTVIVHKIMNIPMKDPTNIPDPYVKLYLLPSRLKESKRKTNVVKDNCNPIFDSTFEYIISTVELLCTELEVTVATQKGFLSGGSPVIGMVKVKLSEPEITLQGLSSWHDLLPEIKWE